MPYKLLFGVGLESDVVDSREEAVRRSKRYLSETGEVKVAFRDTVTGYDYGVRKVDLAQLSLGGHSVKRSQFSIVSLTSASCCPSGGGGGGGDDGSAASPETIDDLMLWLKADSLSLNDGNLISFWADSSGNGNNATQTVVGRRPIYKVNQVNTQPCVQFTNSSNLEITNFLASFTSGEIFWALKAAGGGGFHSFGASGACFYPTAAQIQDDFGRSIRTPPIAPTLAITDWRVYNVSAATGNWTARLDDEEQYTYSLVPNTSWGTGPKIFIGRDAATPPDYFGGLIAEVILYKRVLTTSEHNKVKHYLYNKYKLGPQ